MFGLSEGDIDGCTVTGLVDGFTVSGDSDVGDSVVGPHVVGTLLGDRLGWLVTGLSEGLKEGVVDGAWVGVTDGTSVRVICCPYMALTAAASSRARDTRTSSM